eukprot:m.51748 g.51748  ORF g.51748 m.51748 type:complete len:341 (+) comp12245_c1_seq2:311-1333(+)
MTTTVSILSEADVAAQLPMALAIEASETAFRSLCKGTATVPPRTVIPVTPHNGTTLFKPGHVPGECVGLKIVSVRPNNAESGKPTVPAVVLLVDEETGMPQCMVAATHLTAWRTAAGSAISTRLMAPQEAKTAVVFGAGLQAKAHALAFACVRPLEKVTIVNRTRPRAEALAAELPARVLEETGHSITVDIVVTSEDKQAVERVVRSADLIATCTNSSEPLFDGAWLKPGAHITGVGSYTPTMQEIDAATVKRCQVVIDTDSALPVGDLGFAREAGWKESEGLLGTLGELLGGKISVKRGDAGGTMDCTMFKSVGTAVQDLVTAKAVFDRAAGHGTRVEM